MLAARVGQRVEGAVGWQQGQARALEFRVQKFHVEFGVVNHQTGIADEGEKIRRHVAEQGLALQKLRR